MSSARHLLSRLLRSHVSAVVAACSAGRLRGFCRVLSAVQCALQDCQCTGHRR